MAKKRDLGELGMKIKAEQRVRQIIELLVRSRFDEIVGLTGGIRLSATEIAKALEDYGRTLTIPPREAFRDMDIVEVRDTLPPTWSVVMPLWTREEGKSDLSLELTLVWEGSDPQVELDNLHVR